MQSSGFGVQSSGLGSRVQGDGGNLESGMMITYVDIVVDKGIVHVISDGGDGSQVECATAKDSSGSQAVGEEGRDIHSLKGFLSLLSFGPRHLQDRHAQRRTMALVLCNARR